MCEDDLVRREALVCSESVGDWYEWRLSECLGMVQEDCVFASPVMDT